jgi:putative glutamine amidotransferase
MKPVIGVTASWEEEQMVLKHEYADWILKAGGIPLIVPCVDDPADIRRIGGAIDGLLLTGGADVDPAYYGEEPLPALGRVTPPRDRMELALTRHMLSLDKPVFAICRGLQVLNVAMGGSLHQDVTALGQVLQHSQKAPRSHLSHAVSAAEGSLLARIAGAAQWKVNSFHHQAVKTPAPGFRISAVTSDGVVEAIESEQHTFALGVQWHPEDTAAVDPISRKLFIAFVEACRR